MKLPWKTFRGNHSMEDDVFHGNPVEYFTCNRTESSWSFLVFAHVKLPWKKFSMEIP